MTQREGGQKGVPASRSWPESAERNLLSMLAGLATEHPDQERDECKASQDEFDVHHVPRWSVVTRKMHETK